MAIPKYIGVTKDARVSRMRHTLETIEKGVILHDLKNDSEYSSLSSNNENINKNSIIPLSTLNNNVFKVNLLSNDATNLMVSKETTLSEGVTKALNAIGDDGSEVYVLNMDNLNPYIGDLKSEESTYLYSLKSNCAIDEQGKMDSNGNMHYILENSIAHDGSVVSENVDATIVGDTTTPNVSSVLLHTTGPIINSVKTAQIKLPDGTMVNGSESDFNCTSNGTYTFEYYDKDGNKLLDKSITISNIKKVPIKPLMVNSVNARSSFFITDSNTLYSWGFNEYGQLGDGTTDNKLTPIKINGVTPTQISSGQEYSMAIGSDGELYTWGYNGCGELGNGTSGWSTSLSIPTKITLASGVKPKQIACGQEHSMAIGSDGELYTWGINQYGQLGDGTTTPKNSPTKIILESGVKPVQIACGDFHSMALGDNGVVYTWGYNYYGELGNGTSGYSTYIKCPAKVTFPNGVKLTQISSGMTSSMAISSDGNLYTWGGNVTGQLGDGTTTQRTTPTKITFPNGIKPTQIVGGGGQSLVIGDDGNLYAWGYNGDGRLSDGTTTNKLSPVKITLASGVKPKQVANGKDHLMAIGDDGNLYTWGRNVEGQLGDGTTTKKTISTKLGYTFK